MQTRVLFLVTLAALVAAPVAGASWAGKGMIEPDTRRDVADGFMRLNPDQSAASGRLVYFNSFNTQSAGVAAEVSTSANPNLATVESGYMTSSGRAYAMLGVWKDCNKDGFVGWGDQGLFEYRAELLNALGGGAAVCPVQGIPNPIPRDWVPSHNDGEWVREFVPIGYDKTPNTLPSGVVVPDENPYNVNDLGARVWWDWGLPEDRTRTRCYAFPVQGTFHSTGGLVEYADCFIGFKATDAFNAVAPDGTPLGQLSFRDQPRDQSESGSALNQANPWGEPSDASHASAFDCSQPQLAHQRVPNTDTEVGVSRPRAVPTVGTQGSLAGTANETATAFDDCDRSDNAGEWEHSAAAFPYSAEEDIIATKTTKQQTGYTMRYNEGTRSPARAGTNPQQLGKAAPRDAGTRATEAEGFWVGTSRIGEAYNPLVDRDSQTAQKVTYVTTYGYVTPAAQSKYSLQLTGLTGVYGSDHCAGQVPITGEWECDPAKWWLNPDGTREERTTMDTVASAFTFVAARVGDPYNVRDVDCYDFSTRQLREQGVSWGSVTGTACERPL